MSLSKSRFSALTTLIHSQAQKGVLILFATISALIIVNIDHTPLYHAFLEQIIEIPFFNIKLSIHSWINDFLMAIFFLSVSIEIKHEITNGNLATNSQRILPAVCAISGVIIPIIIYIFFNIYNFKTLKGWAIPSATDIAFALGVFTCLKKDSTYNTLRIFLMTLAVIDDLIAIIIISVFYTKNIEYQFIMYCILVMVPFIFVQFNNAFIYFIAGIILWSLIQKSGIHPSIAGVLLAVIIANEKKSNISKRIQRMISVPIMYIILPLFAFSNSGLNLKDFSYMMFNNSVTLGIIFGLFIGKQLGIFTSLWCFNKCKIYKLPNDTSLLQFYGVSVLCGIGFTMSLFIGILSFDQDQYIQKVQLGVLIASLLSALWGTIILKIANKFRV